MTYGADFSRWDVRWFRGWHGINIFCPDLADIRARQRAQQKIDDEEGLSADAEANLALANEVS